MTWRIVNGSVCGNVSRDLQTMALHAIVSDDRYWFAEHMQTPGQYRWRSISATICLLVVVLLYAPLAGAAWSSYRSACCTSDQCPIPEHHHREKTPAAPAEHADCGHEMVGMMACTMSCCHDSDRSMVTSIAFVLPPAILLLASLAIAPTVGARPPLEFPRAFEPLSPPPRADVAGV